MRGSGDMLLDRQTDYHYTLLPYWGRAKILGYHINGLVCSTSWDDNLIWI